MKIRLTCVSCSEVLEKVRDITTSLEQQLSRDYEKADSDYGFDQFIVVIIAVSDDTLENRKFTKEHNTFGTFKPFRSDENISFVSIALEFRPSDIETMEGTNFSKLIVESLIKRLDRINIRVPK